MSTLSVQMSARTWPIRSVQVQLGNSGPSSMSEPQLRAASGSQQDPVHRRAEQDAPRLTTEASVARGDSLQQLRRRVAASISRSICPASSSTATPAGEPEEEGEFRRKINEYILHDEYYKYVPGEDGEEPLDALGSPPYTDMGSYLTPAYLRTWPTQCLYPGDLEGQYGVRRCQSLAVALKCAPHM